MATKSELEKEYDDLKKELSDQISKERAKLKAKLTALDQVESFSKAVDAITKAFGCFNEALDEIEKKSTPKEYPTREPEYPCVAKAKRSGLIMVAIRPACGDSFDGVVVVPEVNHPIGNIYNCPKSGFTFSPL
jgi:hypothetical protein